MIPAKVRISHKQVAMTDAQQQRQVMQAQWLEQAIAAQNRAPKETLQLSSLTTAKPSGKPSSTASNDCQSESSS